MSNAEAVFVLGVISSVIAIISGTKQAYDGATNVEGLPVTFREVAGRLLLVRTVLESSRQQIRGGMVDEESCRAIKPMVVACEEKTKKLDQLFGEVLRGEDFSVLDRPFHAVLKLGKGSRVEMLMKGILEDVQLLASSCGMNAATTQEFEQIRKAISDISESPDSENQETAFTNNHYGGGPMTNYNVQGDQYTQTQTNHGPGKQWQGAHQTFHFGQEA